MRHLEHDGAGNVGDDAHGGMLDELEAQVLGGVDPDAQLHAREGDGELARVVLAVGVLVVVLDEGGGGGVELERDQVAYARDGGTQRGRCDDGLRTARGVRQPSIFRVYSGTIRHEKCKPALKKQDGLVCRRRLGWTAHVPRDCQVNFVVIRKLYETLRNFVRFYETLF